MKRQLCVTVFFALVLVPDWVSACWPPAGGSYYAPAYVYYQPAPVYYAPPVYCQPVYVQPCAPVTVAPSSSPGLQPPKVERSKPVTPGDAPKAAAPTRPPLIEPVRPAANTEPTKPTGAEPAPPLVPRSDLDKKTEWGAPKPPALEPKGGAKIEFPPLPDTKTPASEPKLPPLVLPGEKTEPKLPVLELPKDGGTKPPVIELPKEPEPKLPTLELPKEGGAKLPALELPKGDSPIKLPDVPGAAAVPVPAPAPDALIPPPGVSVPRNPDALPPLTLPPDTPISPDTKPTQVKSSPLSGALKVSVFPATGTAGANGLRKVGFYNHTDRDLALTIEGQAVKLPAKTYLHAQLPRTFTWKHSDQPVTKETVPTDASGLDVVFRP
ncbi:hypothetical protein GobsT_45430 [Gemmata obscuriglobus]|uniref:Uncharacterized protein n=1 Tax=Gemmata obscuriglobus TaxID=114 RepID=A0A2Z3H1P2_9BACT|nr:hypothetical protein [Gemmata obscuriglobus]AWM37486.1 hypothetical protein C1280_10980 [Gemmata obscuriglobus]QEG29745.1 hypothetical protein GobsT_45430 [Gemmata obscuriglobus]VTS09062.1 unnamed protein product [Gemmata obscuriglobus UQM 2246]